MSFPRVWKAVVLPNSLCLKLITLRQFHTYIYVSTSSPLSPLPESLSMCPFHLHLTVLTKNRWLELPAKSCLPVALGHRQPSEQHSQFITYGCHSELYFIPLLRHLINKRCGMPKDESVIFTSKGDLLHRCEEGHLHTPPPPPQAFGSQLLL